jgi:hypothetical protein
MLPFSPSAFQALLQTSTGQVSNTTTGAAMSLIKKCDVKNHFSAHPHKRLHPFLPVERIEPIDRLEFESCGANTNTPTFAEDYSNEHSSSGVSAISIRISASSDSVVAPAMADYLQG